MFLYPGLSLIRVCTLTLLGVRNHFLYAGFSFIRVSYIGVGLYLKIPANI